MADHFNILDTPPLSLTDTSDWPLAYTTYTPTVKGGGVAVTYGAGAARSGRYHQVGQKVSGYAFIVFGTTTTFPAGALSVSLPVTPLAPTATFTRAIGTGYLIDSSASYVVTLGALALLSSVSETEAIIVLAGGEFSGGTNPASNTAPFAWGDSDVIALQFEYEAA